MKVFFTDLIAYIGPSSWRLLGEQPAAGPRPDSYPFSGSLLKDRGSP